MLIGFAGLPRCFAPRNDVGAKEKCYDTTTSCDYFGGGAGDAHAFCGTQGHAQNRR